MIRRTALAAAALGAATLVSSCATFSRNDVVASVNGRELHRSALAAYTDPKGDGATARVVIEEWLRLAALGVDTDGIADAAALEQRYRDALVDKVDPHLDLAKQRYEQGLDGSPALCLGAIQLADTTDPQEVIDAYDGGMSWADAATKYSADPTLAQSGGLITDQAGNNCLQTAAFSPDLLKLMGDAGAVPGKPVLIDLGKAKAIVLMRPFEDLSRTEASAFVQQEIGLDVRDVMQAASVYLDPQYGRWDTASLSVVPLSQG